MTFARCTLAAIGVLLASPSLAQEVNVYTTREPGLIQPLFDNFTSQTGIQVRSIFVQQGLAERVALEGRNSPADVMIVVDYGDLINLVDRELTQPTASTVLNSVVPDNLRDPDGHWYALSMRARVVYASADRVTDQDITYEDLADPRWNDRVCIRSGQHPYNTSLIAAMIAKKGAAAAEDWLAGVKSNLGRTAGGGDRDVARDILAGICDIGIANSYYVGLMRSGQGGPDQLEWGSAIRVIMPTFEDGVGTHVNISGAAMARHAPNRDNAVRLLEYMVSDEAQKIYAEVNFEYPVKDGAPIDPIIAALGQLTIDPTPLNTIAAHRLEASMLVDKVGFDD